MVSELMLFFIFYVSALLEVSFFPAFSWTGSAFYFVFILSFLLVFFELKKEWLFSMVLGGFLLDIFSGGIFGLKTINLILAVLFTKFLLSFIREKKLFWFIPIFMASFLAYKTSSIIFNLIFWEASSILTRGSYLRIYSILDSFSQYSFWASLVYGATYNLILAILGFLLVKYGFFPLKKRL